MAHQANDQADHAWTKNTFLEYSGVYTPKSANNTLKAPYNNLGLKVERRFTGSKLYCIVNGTEKVYQNRGVLACKMNSNTDLAGVSNVKSLSYDLNISLPPQTEAVIEFTNNNWASYVTGQNGKVTFTSSGNGLAYRIILISKDGSSTPTIMPDADIISSAYLLKCYINYEAVTEGQAISKGYFRTKEFDGEQLSSSKLGYNAFSNFEWLRLWLKTLGSDITIDIESNISPSATKDRNRWRWDILGLKLEDFYKGSIDFTKTDIPEDEYNLLCGATESGTYSGIGLVDEVANVHSQFTDPTGSFSLSTTVSGSQYFLTLKPNSILEVNKIIARKNLTTPIKLNNYGMIRFGSAIDFVDSDSESQENWLGLYTPDSTYDSMPFKLVLSESLNCETEDFVYDLKCYDRNSPFGITNNVVSHILLKQLKSNTEIKSFGFKYVPNVNTINGQVPIYYIRAMALLEPNTVPLYMPKVRMKFYVDKKGVKNPNPLFSWHGCEILLR
jgi:hypothetical protein